jgi:hypothetical protein
LDRRRLPILALLVLALLAAVVYAASGGGSASSTSTSASSPVTPATGVAGITVSAVKTNLDQPVAETTNGSSKQRQGSARNPFAPLPEVAKATSSTTKTAKGSSASPTSGASTSGGSTTTSTPKTSTPSPSGGETTPAKPTKPSSPSTPKTIYHVAVLFGTAPAGTPPVSAQLTPYENLTRQQPLPSTGPPLVVFRGVIAGGKSATFTLVGEAILRGPAACLPSASQCQAIDLQPGQTEELEYIPLGSAAVVYQLQVVSITSSKATASAARRAFHGESKMGLELLRHAGLEALPGLRYSGASGVLVFPRHPASAARARAAARRAHHWR